MGTSCFFSKISVLLIVFFCIDRRHVLAGLMEKYVLIFIFFKNVDYSLNYLNLNISSVFKFVFSIQFLALFSS
jgi:hypothetical protein